MAGQDTDRPAIGRPKAPLPARIAGLVRVATLGDRRATTGGARTLFWWRSHERRCRRRTPRQRVRLISGKIVDAKLGFLIECSVLDHSVSGCRIRLVRDVPLPETFRVYLDKDASIYVVALVWRRGLNLGLRVIDQLQTPEDEEPPFRWRSLGRAYYAID